MTADNISFLGPRRPAAGVCYTVLVQYLQHHAAFEHSMFKTVLLAGGKALLMQLFASIDIINLNSNAFQLMMMFGCLH